jgi:hypothetical protein
MFLIKQKPATLVNSYQKINGAVLKLSDDAQGGMACSWLILKVQQGSMVNAACRACHLLAFKQASVT